MTNRWTIVAGPTPTAPGYVTWRARHGDRIVNIETRVGVELTDAMCDDDWTFSMRRHEAKMRGR